METTWVITVTNDIEIDFIKEIESVSLEQERLLESIMKYMGYTYDQAISYATFVKQLVAECLEEE
jgi:hypothetical protein